ncbi:hypothetical protein V5O48_004142 [Marasmius crinis-equi]|uniref:C2H2-type domain-containing protein n=1 Tax=Marasmius crinis-equi TaxID=585013 RepID=A0ABR3FQZ0_9AGAR
MIPKAKNHVEPKWLGSERAIGREIQSRPNRDASNYAQRGYQNAGKIPLARGHTSTLAAMNPTTRLDETFHTRAFSCSCATCSTSPASFIANSPTVTTDRFGQLHHDKFNASRLPESVSYTPHNGPRREYSTHTLPQQSLDRCPFEGGVPPFALASDANNRTLAVYNEVSRCAARLSPTPPQCKPVLYESVTAAIAATTPHPSHSSQSLPFYYGYRAAKRQKIEVATSLDELGQRSPQSDGSKAKNVTSRGPNVLSAIPIPEPQLDHQCLPTSTSSSDNVSGLAREPRSVDNDDTGTATLGEVAIDEPPKDNTASDFIPINMAADDQSTTETNENCSIREVVCYNDSMKRRKRPAKFSCGQPGCSASFTAAHNLRSKPGIFNHIINFLVPDTSLTF